MSVSLVSVLVSHPVLVCVAVLWYVAGSGFDSVGGWQVVASVYWTSPLFNDLYCLPFRQMMMMMIQRGFIELDTAKITLKNDTKYNTKWVEKQTHDN